MRPCAIGWPEEHMAARQRRGALALALVVFAQMGGANANAETVRDAHRPFDTVRVALDRIKASYVDPVEDDWRLVEAGIAGMSSLPGMQSRAELRARLTAP